MEWKLGMGIDITTERAKKITEYNRELISNIESALNNNSASMYVLDVKKSLETVVRNRSAEKFCEYELTSGTSQYPTDKDLQKFLRSLYLYKYGMKSVNKLSDIYRYVNGIKTAIVNLEIKTEPLKWIVASGRIKEEANNAFQYLTSDNYKRLINDANYHIKSLKNINMASYDAIVRDFYSKGNEYRNTLLSIDKNVLGRKVIIPTISNLNKEYDDIQDNYKSIIKCIGDTKKALKEEVTNYIEEEALKQLQSIPLMSIRIDDLDYKEDLFRDIVLSEGFKSLYDIYNKKERLKRLPEITYAVGEKYISLAEETYEKALQKSKIKLNLDNKTTQTNEILQLLYLYDKNDEISKRAIEEYKRLFDETIDHRYNLNRVNNGLQWMFSSSSDKYKANKDYRSLCSKQIDIKSNIENLAKKQTEAKEKSVTEIWDDFARNTIHYNGVLEGIYEEINNEQSKLEKSDEAEFAKDASRVYETLEKSGYSENTDEIYNSILNSINGRTTTQKPTTNKKASNSHGSNRKPIQQESVNKYTVKEPTIYGLAPYIAKEIDTENLDLNGLKCELRTYQKWGAKFILHQRKALLGDEMGLGKTIQAIAVMVVLKNNGGTHFIVVSPASVLHNWAYEIESKSNLDVEKIYGGNKKELIRVWEDKGGVAIVTYDTLRNLDLNERLLPDLIVVDEAHYIKNPGAQRTVAVTNITKRSKRILLMTGTPLENKVKEMINLVSVVDKNVANQLEWSADSPFTFKSIAMPVYYRRTRDDVLQELPELIETNEWCEMTSADEEMYEKCVLEKNFMRVRRVSWNVPDLNNSSKARRLMEIIKEATSNDRKIIIFSYFLDTLRVLYDYIGDVCVQPINGSVSSSRRLEIIKEFNEAPPGAVLLAQIQTGGTGLNIQAASVVIICEPQYKPSTENQAISRAYRMGQNRNVLVYRLLCEDTVDEKMVSLLNEKQKIFDNFAHESYSASKDKSKMKEEERQITESQFNKIMEEEYNRVHKKVSGM